MEYTTLGRTGLKVSVMGLGCGGFSRIGQATGKTEEESIAIVRYGLNSGINFIALLDRCPKKNGKCSFCDMLINLESENLLKL